MNSKQSIFSFEKVNAGRVKVIETIEEVKEIEVDLKDLQRRKQKYEAALVQLDSDYLAQKTGLETLLAEVDTALDEAAKLGVNGEIEATESDDGNSVSAIK